MEHFNSSDICSALTQLAQSPHGFLFCSGSAALWLEKMLPQFPLFKNSKVAKDDCPFAMHKLEIKRTEFGVLIFPLSLHNACFESKGGFTLFGGALPEQTTLQSCVSKTQANSLLPDTTLVPGRFFSFVMDGPRILARADLLNVHRILYARHENGDVFISTSLNSVGICSDAKLDTEWFAFVHMHPSCASGFFEETCYENVWELSSFQTLQFNCKDKVLSKKTHWVAPSQGTLDNTEATLALRSIFEKAIDERLKRAEDNISADLSGGVDSSAVATSLLRMKKNPSLSVISCQHGQINNPHSDEYTVAKYFEPNPAFMSSLSEIRHNSNKRVG